MRILALNCGSSSVKCAVIDTLRGARLAQASADVVDGADFHGAVRRVVGEVVAASAGPGTAAPEAVVHRLVHGGARFREAVLVDADTIERLRELVPLAPLHLPAALDGLDVARGLFPGLPQVAAFDTAFHADLPRRAREYALPPDLCAARGIRRYGFHGLSHASLMRHVSGFTGKPASALRIVSCHLGNGASVAAIEHGTSTETSMGMTPLEGLIMGTRPGDLDPGILLTLLREAGMTVDALDALLNHRGGLQGLTGTRDMREIQQRASQGDESCRLALAMYGHRVRKYIGAYAAVMGGVDVIALTGGIGEHSATVRHRCLQRLEFLGAELDEARNRDARPTPAQPVVDIGNPAGRVRLLVVAADEEQEMALQAQRLLERPATGPVKLRIAVSARHAHLSQPTVDRLFGPGHVLGVHAPLVQPGQFAAQEMVSLLGPHGRIDHVRLIGPPRARDQVEVSRSDEFLLGVDAPLRLSGDLDGSAPIIVEGPLGRVQLGSGLILARRHVHMNDTEAARLGLHHGDRVAVRVGGQSGRELVFSDVAVRVSPQSASELHLDTDEANAAAVRSGDEAELLREGPSQPRRV